MEKDLNINEAIAQNDIKKINLWSKENIHRFGRLKTPKEIMLISTKEPFDPNYYVSYLIEKYTKILKS